MYPYSLDLIIRAEHASYEALQYHLWHQPEHKEATFTRLACPLQARDPLNLCPERIGENSIPFAQYARKMRDHRRRKETTKIKPSTHPIEWAWSNGRPALGFKPECVPVAFEYLPDAEQLTYLTSTSVTEETTFVLGETMDSRASDPIPDYLLAREVGYNLTSMELAFSGGEDDDDDNSPRDGSQTLDVCDHWSGYQPPTPYMRSWVDWEKRRKFSGTVIRVYPQNRNGTLDFQVEGLPRTDGNTAANLRNHWRQRAAELVIASGYRGQLSWEDYQNWLEYNRDERQSIGMTQMQSELYYNAADGEQELRRLEWLDREYHEVYEENEELSDQQVRDGDVPARILHLRTHPNRAIAELSMREGHQNSPTMLGLSPTVNWLRDDEEDDTTYSERFYNYLDGVEYALLEANSKRQQARANANSQSMVSGS